MRVDYRFESASINDAFKRLAALGQDMRPITRAIAAVLASESEDAFDSESDPTTGSPWPALSPSYKEKLEAQGKTGKMLQRSMGGLAMSLTTDFDAVSVAIGTNKVYGALMFFGGAAGMPAGPAAVSARPYMGLSPQGITTIINIINQKHAEATGQ